MKLIRSLPFLILCSFLSALHPFAVAADESVEQVSYVRQIQPFFEKYCTICHGEEDAKGGLSLHDFPALLKGGESGEELVVSGKSAESHLWKVVSGIEEPRMPPEKSKQPTAAELEILKKWIEQGAPGPEEKSVAMTRVPKLELPSVKVTHHRMAPAVSVVYHSDGTRLYIVRGGSVEGWDLGSGKKTATYSGDEYPLNRVAVSSDGALIAGAGGAPGVMGRIFLWTPEGVLVKTIEGHADSIYGLDFSPDGKLLVSASYDKLLKIWDVSSGHEIHTLKHHTGAVFEARFSPDGKYIASASADQTLKIWDVASGKRLQTLTEATKGLSTVVWKPDGSEFAAGGVDKIIRTWSWEQGQAKLKKNTFAHNGSILAMGYHPHDGKLYSSGEDRQIKGWDTETLSETLVFPSPADWGEALIVSPDARTLAVAIHDGTVNLYSLETGEVQKRLADSRPAAEESDVGVPSNEEGRVVLVSAEKPPVAEEQPNPPAPVLSGVSPRSVVRGNKVTLALSGRNLWRSEKIWLGPNWPHQLLPGDEMKPDEIRCEMEIPQGAEPGLYEVRLRTPLGTTESKSFYVGPFPEIGESETRLEKPGETIFPLESSFSGVIDVPGDRDLWPFEVSAGEEVVFDLQGLSFGSSLEPKLSILDSAGKEMATSQRSMLRKSVWVGFRAEQGGRYTLVVEDRNFSGSGGHFYLVHAGKFPFVTETFPLGISTNAPQSVIQIAGFNLKGMTEFSPADRTPGHHAVRVQVGDQQSLNSIEYDVTDSPELVENSAEVTGGEPQVIPVPGSVSGRIQGRVAGNTDVDQFAFDAVGGDQLTLEIGARRHYGSPLDSELQILSNAGEPLARFTARPVAETYTVLRDHDSRVPGIRLQNWNEFEVGDFLLIGNEILKILSFPAGPDSDIAFSSKDGIRKAELGSTPAGHALNTPVYKVEMHPPGTSFPSNGMPVRQIYWQNDDGIPGFLSDSQILFDVPATGRYLVRVRDVRGQEGQEYRYRLSIRRRSEEFQVSMVPQTPNIPIGGSLPVTITVDRQEGFVGPVDVAVTGLPPGITSSDLKIGSNGVNGVFTLTSDGERRELPLEQWCNLKVTASGLINGKEMTRSVPFSFGESAITLTSPPSLKVSVEPQTLGLSSGQEGTFQVTIERKNGFKGRVPLEVLNLPHGFSLLDVGLNGILVEENESVRNFTIRCEEFVQPGEYLIYAAGRLESLGERHPSGPIRVIVGAASETAELSP